MGNEASKTKEMCAEDLLPFLVGDGIDIGCGPDPILPTVDQFDLAQGDANQITAKISKRYDFVFSSHCLEHMNDPYLAIKEWFALVKPGGHLIVLVPDEDLYEQGIFPSRFNPDHKFTFTISKTRSWSPQSINVMDLISTLGGTLVSIKLHDAGYDRQLVNFQQGSSLATRFTFKMTRLFPTFKTPILRWGSKFGAIIDQTAFEKIVLAQIFFVVHKNV